jgi:nucleotide-binding universal stress UspA family protein
MIRLAKLLVPTDFSEDSEQAARYAVELAKRFQAEIHCIHVVDIPADLLSTSAYYMTGPSEAFLDQIRKESKKNLEAFAKKNLEEGVQVRTAFLEGSPFVEIIRYAHNQEIDLVVIATHGRTGLRHVLFGSVAEKVVRKAPCPVLVVKRKERDFVLP